MKRIAVVGSGLIGLSVAWRLAQSGRAVVVLESGTVGSEASWAGAGMLAPGGEVDHDSPVALAAVASRAAYPGFVSELASASETPIDFQPCGALDLAFSEAELNDMQARAERQLAFGITSKSVSREHIRTFWPHLRLAAIAGGMFYPDDAIVSPRDLITALERACSALGVAIEEKAAVRRVRVSESEVELSTDRFNCACEAAVIAAGAWSSAIAVEGVPQLPAVEPVKGILLGYRQPAQTCGTILRHGHTYLLQRANGLLIAGASAQRLGFDRSIDPKVVAGLATEAASILPHLAETEPTEIWSGLRPYAAELCIGPWHSRRLHLAYGHYRNGILLAPWTASRVSSELNASLERL